ncbi:MAG: phytanoyl-CoA dioxygenase family protein [Nitrospira sp.]
MMIPQLERTVFGTYLIVDKIYAYRNLVSRREKQVSWRWHADNHPRQIKKIALYLTDVDQDTGAMEYLRSTRTGEALLMEPKPLLGVNITDRKLAEYHANGYQPYRLTGKSGTAVLFDDNIVHKANIPIKGYRDAIFLQIRPCTFRPERYIDEQWTGSFEHVDFNADPYEYQPKPKSKSYMHSSAY